MDAVLQILDVLFWEDLWAPLSLLQIGCKLGTRTPITNLLLRFLINKLRHLVRCTLLYHIAVGIQARHWLVSGVASGLITIYVSVIGNGVGLVVVDVLLFLSYARSLLGCTYKGAGGWTVSIGWPVSTKSGVTRCSRSIFIFFIIECRFLVWLLLNLLAILCHLDCLRRILLLSFLASCRTRCLAASI